MKRIHHYVLYFLIVNFMIGFVYADSEEFAEAKKIIDAKTSCAKLTDAQLEILGDYLMEQMHPGEAHEVMDKMMGGEGSETLRLMHIAMAKRLYCNDGSGSAYYGMMGSMGGGMMNMMGTNMMGYGMMGNYGTGFGYWNLINFLNVVLLAGLIILVYLWIIKVWKELSNAKK